MAGESSRVAPTEVQVVQSNSTALPQVQTYFQGTPRAPNLGIDNIINNIARGNAKLQETFSGINAESRLDGELAFVQGKAIRDLGGNVFKEAGYKKAEALRLTNTFFDQEANLIDTNYSGLSPDEYRAKLGERVKDMSIGLPKNQQDFIGKLMVANSEKLFSKHAAVHTQYNKSADIKAIGADIVSGLNYSVKNAITPGNWGTLSPEEHTAAVVNGIVGSLNKDNSKLYDLLTTPTIDAPLDGELGIDELQSFIKGLSLDQQLQIDAASKNFLRKETSKFDLERSVKLDDLTQSILTGKVTTIEDAMSQAAIVNPRMSDEDKASLFELTAKAITAFKTTQAFTSAIDPMAKLEADLGSRKITTAQFITKNKELLDRQSGVVTNSIALNLAQAASTIVGRRNAEDLRKIELAEQQRISEEQKAVLAVAKQELARQQDAYKAGITEREGIIAEVSARGLRGEHISAEEYTAAAKSLEDFIGSQPDTVTGGVLNALAKHAVATRKTATDISIAQNKASTDEIIFNNAIRSRTVNALPEDIVKKGLNSVYSSLLSQATEEERLNAIAGGSDTADPIAVSNNFFNKQLNWLVKSGTVDKQFSAIMSHGINSAILVDNGEGKGIQVPQRASIEFIDTYKQIKSQDPNLAKKYLDKDALLAAERIISYGVDTASGIKAHLEYKNRQVYTSPSDDGKKQVAKELLSATTKYVSPASLYNHIPGGSSSSGIDYGGALKSAVADLSNNTSNRMANLIIAEANDLYAQELAQSKGDSKEVDIITKLVADSVYRRTILYDGDILSLNNGEDVLTEMFGDQRSSYMEAPDHVGKAIDMFLDEIRYNSGKSSVGASGDSNELPYDVVGDLVVTLDPNTKNFVVFDDGNPAHVFIKPMSEVGAYYHKAPLRAIQTQ